MVSFQASAVLCCVPWVSYHSLHTKRALILEKLQNPIWIRKVQVYRIPKPSGFQFLRLNQIELFDCVVLCLMRGCNGYKKGGLGSDPCFCKKFPPSHTAGKSKIIYKIN